MRVQLHGADGTERETKYDTLHEPPRTWKFEGRIFKYAGTQDHVAHYGEVVDVQGE